MAKSKGIVATIDVKANEQLMSMMDQLVAGDMQDKALLKGTLAGAKVILAEAIVRVPVDTGLLKSQLKTGKINKRKSKKTGQIGHEVKSTAKAPHAHLVEKGSPKRGIAPNPFLRNSADAKQAEIRAAVVDASIKGVKALLKKGGIKAIDKDAAFDQVLEDL